MPPQPHAAQDPLPEAQIWRDLFERSFIGPLAVLGDAGVSFEERLCQETDHVPLGKYGTPEEVAVAVETLLGAFTDQITGVNITMTAALRALTSGGPEGLATRPGCGGIFEAALPEAAQLGA